ncbi:hypothetical protein GCM10022408_16070 [Hymenobacter fastidiosus]|uniref:Lipoprotein n=1 Tax=Hymenobacter fastidiosus TaxID=486264 RepID=A0ABP7S0W3_9BACT
MKIRFPLAALGLLLVSVSCSHDTVTQSPKKYNAVSTQSARRPNDKSKFKKNRSAGLGIDLNARNPYKSGTTNAPKSYKYNNNPR